MPQCTIKHETWANFDPTLPIDSTKELQLYFDTTGPGVVGNITASIRDSDNACVVTSGPFDTSVGRVSIHFSQHQLAGASYVSWFFVCTADATATVFHMTLNIEQPAGKQQVRPVTVDGTVSGEGPYVVGIDGCDIV